MAFNEIITVCLAACIGGIGWAIKLLITLNARSQVIDARWDAHEKSDDDRHKENKDKFDSLFEQIRQLRLSGERISRK